MNAGSAPRKPVGRTASLRGEHGFRAFFHDLMRETPAGGSPTELLLDASRRLSRLTVMDAVELRFQDGARYFRARAWTRPIESAQVQVLPCTHGGNGAWLAASDDQTVLESLCRDLQTGTADAAALELTVGGSYCATSLADHAPFGRELAAYPHAAGLGVGREFRSMAIVPLVFGGHVVGILKLKSTRKEPRLPRLVAALEPLAETLAVLVARQGSVWALRERVKELSCLYGLAKVIENELGDAQIDTQAIVNLMPPAWQYPEIASARIQMGDKVFTSAGFHEGVARQGADVLVRGAVRGRVEVHYAERRAAMDEGPFLAEERALLDTVARQLGLLWERKQTALEKQELEGHLQRADRLATVGLLAAGLAHELNEPLGNVLGFAQLAQKVEGLPLQARADVDKIIEAALHARDVIRKLLTSARQTAGEPAQVNLNEIVEETLALLESRFVRQGVKVDRRLAPELPPLFADRGQLTQVCVNLAVNAAQAMPHGGTLTVETQTENGRIHLRVRDSGGGIRPEVMDKIFLPFFTTKEAQEGTGLGLSVVHGIVTAHRGTIAVESPPGGGASFDVSLPARDAPDRVAGDQGGRS